MPDPFDAARRALDDVPAPDLWGEAERRAAGASVVALDADHHRARRPGRWLAAVAAVAVAAVGVATVLVDDDGDQGLETSPTTEAPDLGTTVEGPDCMVGISGEPLLMEEGSADPPLFDTVGQPEGQLVAHTMLGTQVAELHVPGLVLDDLLGERVEEVELRRGTASVWFGADFVQVRWFSGGQEPCESFTVTVAGGTEDGNRHAAVDFAERILLPSDLDNLAAASLEGTEWALDSTTVAGDTTPGTGVPFTFAGGEATWTDGCNTFGAPFDQPSPTSLELGDPRATEPVISCPFNPTSQAIDAVMGADDIEVTFGSGRDIVVLSAGDATLVLRPG